MENSNDILPRLAIKRRLEDIIVDEWKLDLVDYFKTSVDVPPQVLISIMNEQFQPLNPNVYNKRLVSTLNISVIVFSKREETKVHQIINQLLNLDPTDFPGLQIISVSPSSSIPSETNWQNDASEGHVMADATLEIKYYFNRGK
ncbi:hypothetical protein RIM49_003080 [Enterobacter kobei]|uniref:hypothetical protein n=1 Tax=Enterobacter kobei TaxID=208224 RepID=UPI0020BFFF11|nr:hypothetical protein [Enterobacter kobei]ELC0996430.1 hypothetical protein [Enterobacter kobei]MCL5532299.1 hypothetical protein [Enterobacter kobei]